MIDFNKQTTEITCTKCERKVTVSIKEIAMQATVSCSCGQKMKLVDKDGTNKKKIDEVNNQFKKLDNALKNLGN